MCVKFHLNAHYSILKENFYFCLKLDIRFNFGVVTPKSQFNLS